MNWIIVETSTKVTAAKEGLVMDEFLRKLNELYIPLYARISGRHRRGHKRSN